MSSSVFCVKGKLRPTTKLLYEKGIILKKVSEKDGYIFFSTYGKDTEIAIKTLNEVGKEYTITKDGRGKTFFKSNIIRVGIYIAFVLGILLVYLYSGKVTTVEVVGNKTVSTEEIVATINKEISFPAQKKFLDCDKISKSIILMQGISSASAEIKGRVLRISILEEPPLPIILDRTDYADVVSKYDGIITRIITYSGSPLVSAGDTVKVGQKLISCEVKTADDIVIKENALGDVYARVWVTESKVFTPTVMVTKRTGRTESEVSFFAEKSEYKGKFLNYEKTTEVGFLEGVVPLKYYVTTYYETKKEEIEFDFYANEENVVKEEIKKIEEKFTGEESPIRTWYDVKTLDKSILLVIYYEIELKIN